MVTKAGIHDQLRRFGERLDALSVQVNHSLATKASTDSIGHMQATGLTEAQAALNVRVENLDGKVRACAVDAANTCVCVCLCVSVCVYVCGLPGWEASKTTTEARGS